MHRFFAPAVLSLAVLTAPACAADPSPVAPHPCKIEGVEGDVRCATFPVWENRETRTGRKIPMNIVILPALGAEKLPDPIFYLAGGPGQGASTTAEGWARAKDLRARRDLVLIDQRGTGGSNPLDCKMFGEPSDVKLLVSEFLKKSSVERCRAELEKHADLAQYNTEYSVDDFDEVRAWLGYGKVNLFGGSYGTTSAQVYVRRHPDSIRAVVLDGLAPVDEPIPLHHAAAGQRAADLLFAECAADAACHAAFPNPGAELQEVMARVEKGVEVEIRDPRTKQLVKVRPNRGMVAEGIRLFLYSVEEDGKNSLPLRIHRALSGDYRPLVEAALEGRLGLEEAIEEGMWLSLTCAEDIPFITPAIAEKETANTFLGDYRVRAQTEACKVWPRSKISPGYRELVRSDLPVLMISGERDPVTPPSFGERVARGFPNGLHLIVPHGGHGADNDCVNGIALRFLDQASVKGLDTSCVAKTEPAKFALELPAGNLASDSKPVAPHPCKIEGIEGEVRCATLPVWENRETKKGRKIPMNIVILPALGPDKVPDPIFYFAGGPGQGAATTAEGWAQSDLRARRDIVLVDQRGTGKSNPLDCEMFGKPSDLKLLASRFLEKSEVERCRAELEKMADLTQYNTEYSADDVEDVRAWLGYGKINLFGGSYGTTSAQVYLRRHPGSVRTAVLDGVAPVDEPNPLHHAAAGQRAADLLFAECAADAACHAAFPRPGAELKEVMARVDRGVEVEVEDPRTKQKVKVRPNRGVVADGIRQFLYGAEEDGKNSLPLRIHRAFEGDYRPLVEAALRSRLGIERALEMGMWLSLTCTETIPRIDPGIVAKETADTYLGDYRVRTQTEACRFWPRGKVSPGFWDPVRSDLPVLMISGERDPVTPPSFGERVAKGFPNGLQLVVPHGGHGADSDCVNGITLEFLNRASAKGLDTSCVKKSEPAKFSLELPAEKG